MSSLTGLVNKVAAEVEAEANREGASVSSLICVLRGAPEGAATSNQRASYGGRGAPHLQCPILHALEQLQAKSSTMLRALVQDEISSIEALFVRSSCTAQWLHSVRSRLERGMERVRTMRNRIEISTGKDVEKRRTRVDKWTAKLAQERSEVQVEREECVQLEKERAASKEKLGQLLAKLQVG